MVEIIFMDLPEKMVEKAKELISQDPLIGEHCTFTTAEELSDVSFSDILEKDTQTTEEVDYE